MDRQLENAIDDSQTTIRVTGYLNSADFPVPGTIIIESETIRYNNTTDREFVDCVRGYNSTTAVAHATQTEVTFDAVIPEAVASGATTALDNLAAVAINTTLVSDTDNTDDLGSIAISWKDLYLKGELNFTGQAHIQSAITGEIRLVDDVNALDLLNIVYDTGNGETQVIADQSIRLVSQTGGSIAIDVGPAGTMLEIADISGGGATQTSLFLYDVDNGQIEQVTVGAADSGGVGFKVLRIPN